jgi:hypothetical protein
MSSPTQRALQILDPKKAVRTPAAGLNPSESAKAHGQRRKRGAQCNAGCEMQCVPLDSEGAAGNMINLLVHPRQTGPLGTGR